MQGEKALLGLWLSQNEGAKFWLSVLNELKNRGIEDILIACVDGLKGFPDAIEAVYPHTQIQLCVVHQIRYSLNFVVWKDKKAVARDLRKVYAAATLQEAEQAFIDFQNTWDNKYPSISPSWQRNWDRLTGFFDYPPPIRKVIYTTNAIESLNASIKKVTRNRKQFPNDEAIIKVVYLALQNAAKKWSMPIHDWKPALNQFMIVFGDRITEYV